MFKKSYMFASASIGMIGNLPVYKKHSIYIRLSRSSFLERGIKFTIDSEANIVLPNKHFNFFRGLCAPFFEKIFETMPKSNRV